MKLFTAMQIREAIAHAKSGGQALHVWQPRAGLNVFYWDDAKAPDCFRRAARSGKPFGRLFDGDAVRLIKTARRLGVSCIVIHNDLTDKAHVDLCGRPLERAIAEASKYGMVGDEDTPAGVLMMAQTLQTAAEFRRRWLNEPRGDARTAR